MLSLINEIQKRDGTEERERQKEESYKVCREGAKGQGERRRRVRADRGWLWVSSRGWVGGLVGGEHQRAHPTLIARG